MFQPSPEILKKYADVLVKFALWDGKGARKGETVCLQVPESSRPILDPLIESTLEVGANPLIMLLPEGIDRWESVPRIFYEKGTMEQITYMPKEYLLGRIQNTDHYVCMISSANQKELEGVDSSKIMARQQAVKFYKDARFEKEDAGKLTWVLALFGTEAMASEAKMPLEEYWQQIISACYLDEDNPTARWQETFRFIDEYKKKLTELKIESVHVTAKDIELTVKIGSNRQWLGGSGRNIPSYEIYVTPDWRGTNGHIAFNQPLYRFGAVIKDVRLEFKDGTVVQATASQNEQLLRDMIAVNGANKIGEFSLTDSRLSKITRSMAETLYDENVGGKYGNTHIALGSSYKDSYIGDITAVPSEQWETMGFNDSAIHTDIMSTTDRTVEATLADGSKKVIYQDGKFTI